MAPDVNTSDSFDSESGRRAAFAHELIHNFAAIISNLDYARRLLSPTLANHDDDLASIDRCIDLALYQARAQRYDAYNLIAQQWPELIGELNRPRIERRSALEILEEMLPAYERQARGRGVSIRVDPSVDVFPRMDLEVFAIQRVFHNILANAIKYSFRGGKGRLRYIRIWYKCVDPPGKRWGIFFQNYGVGVMPQEAAEIFKPGYRGLMARADGTLGCGLGLSEARRCVEAHHGTIRLRSVLVGEEESDDPEKGVPGVHLTTVWIILPEHTNISGRLGE